MPDWRSITRRRSVGRAAGAVGAGWPDRPRAAAAPAVSGKRPYRKLESASPHWLIDWPEGMEMSEHEPLSAGVPVGNTKASAMGLHEEAAPAAEALPAPQVLHEDIGAIGRSGSV